ncbi:MAG TPA: ornithine cyclodeaminase family protein [Dongiaceae bacterium]
MHVISAEQVHALLDYPALVEALRDLFRRGVDDAKAIHLTEKLPDGRENIWLLLPAWQHGRNQGVKLVSVFPGNDAKGLLSIVGVYVLFDGTNGYPLAVIDGAALTLRKTAANSALAATFLAPKDAGKLLMIGAGQLSPHLAMAHSAVRPIREVRVWNRSVAKAEQMAATLKLPGVRVEATDDLEAAVRWADVISAATMAKEPMIKGAWLRPGQHIDLVGGFRPDMREADDEAVRRARVFIDAWFTAGAHCGDICKPLEAGIIAKDAITDTFQLARGEKPGRQSDSEITLFKSGGGGHEDLGTAQHLLAKLEQR